LKRNYKRLYFAVVTEASWSRWDCRKLSPGTTREGRTHTLTHNTPSSCTWLMMLETV